MPAWHDIEPAALKTQLPILWSWKFDRATGEFTGRLAGERIQTVFGVNLRGARMCDVFSGREFVKMQARHARVANEPAFFRGHGLVFYHRDRLDFGERVILPLSDDGMNGDGVIGATEFESRPLTLAGESEPRVEIEQWFAFD